MGKPLTLAIVIPVYNEEHHLRACLEAIANQTVAPDEVIVVNNNSTDGTVAIAEEFDFVTVVHEFVQGFIPPRNRGFNTAKSDLLGRIDADARLEPDWVERAKANFADPNVAALTGPAFALSTYQEWVPRSRVWPLMYFWWTDAEFGIPVIWGANMVIRRTAWRAIRSEASWDDTLVHEDQDLSYLLAGAGLRAHRDNNLVITIDGDSYHDWAKFSEYAYRRWTTKRYHALRQTLGLDATRVPSFKRIAYFTGVVPLGVLFIMTSLPLGVIHLILVKLRPLANDESL